jgi:hypothetical protein
MPDQTVTLNNTEWTQLLAVLAMAQGPGISWQTINPLVMRIGEQLRQQSPEAGLGTPPGSNPSQFVASRPNGPLDEPTGLADHPDMQPSGSLHRRVPRPS